MPFQELVAKRILIDSGIFHLSDDVIQLGDSLEEGLKTSVKRYGKQWKHGDVRLIVNLTLGTAAEVSMIRSADAQTGMVSFPTKIEPGDYKLAIWHTDTLPQRECLTPNRLRKKNLFVADVAIFCSDADKLVALKTIRNSSRGVEALGSASNLIAWVNQLFEIDEDRTGMLLREILDSKYLNVKALIWNMKANLITGQTETTILKEANELISKWNLQK